MAVARAYALAMAELLDPTGELFGQRIISKGDDGSALINHSKRLMQVHPLLVPAPILIPARTSALHLWFSLYYSPAPAIALSQLLTQREDTW